MGLRRDLHIVLACLVGTSVLFWIDVRSDRAESQQLLDWKEELKQINEEIQKSEDLRDRHLATARRAEDQGMRWQFMQDQKQEATRAFQKADANKQEAALLQKQVDRLKARKAQLLEEHPEADEIKRSP